MSGMEPSCGALISNRQEPLQSTCNEQISTFVCTVAGVDCTLFSRSMAHPLKDLCESSCGGCANCADQRAGMTNNIAYPFPASLRNKLLVIGKQAANTELERTAFRAKERVTAGYTRTDRRGDPYPGMKVWSGPRYMPGTISKPDSVLQ